MLAVDDFFKTDSPLSRVFPGFTPRGPQLALSRGIELGLRQNRHYIGEAGTGVGKSLAYLLPLILWALEKSTADKITRAMVSTYTKVLQRQIFDKDLPRLQKVVGNFRYALCVGGENYLCRKRLAATANLGLLEGASEGALLNEIFKWGDLHPDAMYHDLDFRVPEWFWRRLSRDVHTCNEKQCNYKISCGWVRAKEQQKTAHILVSNHHLAFCNIKLGWKLFPDVSAVVFDEAHEVHDVAVASLGVTASSARIRSIVDPLYNPKTGRGMISHMPERGDLVENIEEIDRLAGIVGSKLGAGQKIIGSKGDIHVEKLAMRMSGLAEICGALDKDVFGASVGGLKEEAVNLSHINNQDVGKDDEGERKHRYVFWSSATANRWQLTASPLEVGPLLKKVLFGKEIGETTDHRDQEPKRVLPVSLVSATLSVNGRFTYFKSELGLNGSCMEAALGSPFNYGDQAVVYAPAGLPDPKDGAYKHAVTAEILKLLEIFQGNTMILFTSYRLMNEMHGMLRERLPSLHFLRQGDMPGNQIVEQFKKLDRAVLLGTSSFWQGVDIPGDDLRCVIITRLPFSNPDDPISLARQELLKEKGLSSFEIFNRLQLPKAVLQFKQGFGRLIRTANDRGVVAILDNRLYSKAYGKTFFKAIPEGCRIVKNLGQIPRRLT